MSTTQYQEQKAGKGIRARRAVILTLALTFVLVVSVGFCIFSDESVDAAGHSHDGKDFKEWSNPTSLPGDPGNYYLSTDVTMTSNWSPWIPDNSISLCLNGHSITFITGDESAIRITSDMTLNLYDCQDDHGTITHGIDEGGAKYTGRAVNVSGTFNMYGGTITANEVKNGAGVYVSEYGTFNMYGGSITDNTASYSGGGVRVSYKSTFNMSGGTISGNTATKGGGVYVVSDGIVNLQGEIAISGNTSSNVFLDGDSILIGVSGPISSGEVYVKLKTAGVFTSGYSTYNTKDPSTIFHSDDSSYKVAWNSENTEAELVSAGPTVTFNGNGGIGTMEAEQFTPGVPQALTPNAFERTGYTFVGWNTDSSATTAQYTDGQSITIEESITVYAIWSANTYTVQFDGNGNTSGSMSNQQFTYNVPQALTLNAFAKTGYTFLGWNTDAEATTVKYTDGQEITVSENMTLYALWSENKLTVTFDGNGSTSGSMDPQVIKSSDESKNLTANAFARTNKVFTGWNTQQDGQGDAYVECADVSALLTSPTATVTLYAQWADPKPCTVTIVQPTGGTIAPADTFTVTNGTWSINDKTMIISGSDIGEKTLEVTVNEGYVFDGFTINGAPAPSSGTIAIDTTISASVLKIITVPQGKTLTYNGQEQVGVDPYNTEQMSYANEKKTNVGEYTATVTPKAGFCWDSTGSVEEKSVSWKIDRANATVTAEDKTKTVGAADPQFTAKVSGVFGSDTLVYKLTREAGEDAGSYKITASGEAVQGNYNVTYVDGTLKIENQPSSSGFDWWIIPVVVVIIAVCAAGAYWFFIRPKA